MYHRNMERWLYQTQDSCHCTQHQLVQWIHYYPMSVFKLFNYIIYNIYWQLTHTQTHTHTHAMLSCCAFHKRSWMFQHFNTVIKQHFLSLWFAACGLWVLSHAFLLTRVNVFLSVWKKEKPPSDNHSHQQVRFFFRCRFSVLEVKYFTHLFSLHHISLHLHMWLKERNLP